MRETSVKEAHRMDTILIIVSIVVWIVLAIWGIYITMVNGIAGAGMSLVVYVIAVSGWIKLIKVWIEERGKLLGEIRNEQLSEEIKRLRDVIEELARSLKR